MSDFFTTLVALQPTSPTTTTGGATPQIPGTTKPQTQAVYTLVRSTGVKTK